MIDLWHRQGKWRDVSTQGSQVLHLQWRMACANMKQASGVPLPFDHFGEDEALVANTQLTSLASACIFLLLDRFLKAAQLP